VNPRVVTLGAVASGMMAVYPTPPSMSRKESNNPATTSKFLFYSGKKLKKADDLCVFSGSGNSELSSSVADYLGIPLSKISVKRFADGECSIKVNETVRGKNVVIIQSTCPPNLNDQVMELLLMVSTMRRASAKSITVVIPYCAYSRSDQKNQPRTPIASSDLMRMLDSMGTDRVICVDMHAGQMQGFLPPAIPSDNITAIKVAATYFAEKTDLSDDVVIVAPAAEAVPRAKDFWNSLVGRGKENAKFAMVIRKPNLEEQERPQKTKDLLSITANEYEVVGSDVVRGSDAIIVSDIIDSAKSICNVAETLTASGARNVYAFSTHGLFTGSANDRIDKSSIKQVIVTNTVSANPESEKIDRISVAPLLAETIRRICEKESLESLFIVPKPNADSQ